MNTVHVHVPYPRIEEYISFIKQKKLNLEIYFPSSSLDTIRTEDIRQIKKSLDYSPSISFHAPFMDLSPGAVDSKVRAVTVERFSHVLDIAEILSPGVIVLHSGYEKWRFAHRVDIWLEESTATWTPLIKRAVNLGVKLAIENIFEDEPSNLEMLMKELYSENFGICFDTGHCNLFSRVPLMKWIESLKPYIFEIHLHDNDKTTDLHLPVGDGTFDFNALFSNIDSGRNYIYTIEAHNPEKVLKSLERLKSFI